MNDKYFDKDEGNGVVKIKDHIKTTKLYVYMNFTKKNNPNLDIMEKAMDEIMSIV